HHAAAKPYLESAHAGDRVLLVAAHAIAELYATLTVLPVSPRIAPASAQRLIETSVLAVAEVVEIGRDDYEVVIERMATLGLLSGAVYDALHVRAAERTGASELVTLNGRDFRRMPPEPACTLVVL
ncbi:MAG: VapC toxin family PIN domain ribonuclease, partial [Bacteroidota bacterium]